MIPFASKRNQVYPVLFQGKAAVGKWFTYLEDWQRETDLYRDLSGKLSVLHVRKEIPGVLVTDYCPKPTLLHVLEKQERYGFSPAPWIGLGLWLERCHALCGKLPLEGNLRNFLWDPFQEEVIGLDLESFLPSTLVACGAQMIAGILTYAPERSAVKKQAADLLMTQLKVSEEEVIRAERQRKARRQTRALAPVSGIVLAGGKSSRMGQDKGRLKLFGKTFLQRQVEKLQTLGVQDILISGGQGPVIPGTLRVADQFLDRGPLGGLHACLQRAQNSRCLVLTVDTPLVPAAALDHLRRTHREGVTVLCHGEKEETLISVMDREAAKTIQTLISQKSAPVKALKSHVSWSRWEYRGPEEFLQNCNTPDDYEAVKSLAEIYAAGGIPL